LEREPSFVAKYDKPQLWLDGLGLLHTPSVKSGTILHVLNNFSECFGRAGLTLIFFWKAGET